MVGVYLRILAFMLTEVTLPCAAQVVDQGIPKLLFNPGFGNGIDTCKGYLTRNGAAEAREMDDHYRNIRDVEHENAT